ncbi:MAG TPA: STAS/SEC14 domain-containing protein [Vicinamibacterales bacterium]
MSRSARSSRPAPAPAPALRSDGANVYRADISGRLTEDGLKALQRAAAQEIRRGGRLRLLIVLKEFEGWDNGAGRDLGFYIRHGSDIERIAIVGDERWQSEALMFAGAGLRKAPVVYFRSRDALQAASWVAEDLSPS